MKIKFLGTSAGWPLPRLGCQCEICSSKDPKDRRTRTQILINDSILLDAGPDSYTHLIKEDTHKIKAILVSHAHPDHIFGFLDLSHIYTPNKEIKLYVTQPVLNGIRRIFNIPLKPIKPIVVKPNQVFTIKNIKIEYFPVIHGKTLAFGIKVKDNKILAYIPDFNRILPSSQKIIRGCHTLVIDGSSLNRLGQTPSHISIKDGIIIAKKLRPKSTYFVHIGHKTGTHQFLENYLKQNAGPKFHIAYDDLELEL